MDNFQKALNESGIYGEVAEIRYPLVTIKGLPKVRPQQTIIFNNGDIGSVFDIEKEHIQALVFSNNPPSIQAQVAPLMMPLGINVSNQLLGKIVNPLGQETTNEKFEINMQNISYKSIFSESFGISERITIKEPFLTGQMKVDLLLPLGKGQRELILGDGKTGKTSLILSIIETQAQHEESVIIYAGIGKKAAEINQIKDYLINHKLMSKTVLITSLSADNAGLIYITPYSAMTIAEFFAKQGKDVTLILDDLSIHAVRYREIALLSRRFPGRESYPGDIFYSHASLLERAGYFKNENNQPYSITCLPIASTVEGDITGYISTNLMSITDGHILFDSDIYNKGQRPAINIPLSVTRVGRQTQTALLREINVEILSSLSQYEKMKNIMHLGSEISQESKNIIAKGLAFENMLQQELNVIKKPVQVVIFALAYANPGQFGEISDYNKVLSNLLNIANTKEGAQEVQKVADSNNINELLERISQSPVLSPLCKKEAT